MTQDVEQQDTESQDDVQNQADTRTFTQTDVDRIVEDRIARERKRLEKRFDGVDVSRYQELMQAEEQRQLQEQKRRGEFDNILKQTVEKKDNVITQLQRELQNIKVDGALVNAASQYKAVNPQQVVKLLKDQVRLGETGEAEVVDPGTGQVRYTDAGDPLGIDNLVQEFLATNPHFKQSTPGGSGSKSNTSVNTDGRVDIGSLDMKNPAHRALYAKMRQAN